MTGFEESESSRLNKLATGLKRTGDLDGAIAILRQIKALEGDQYQETRLAKLLQQSGQIDAALVEIQWLLDHSQEHARALFSHQPASVIQCQHASWCARVHADAALICKRAKLPELQAQHEQLQERYSSLRRRLDPVASADVKAKFAAWEKVKRPGVVAIQRFFKR